MNKLLLITAVTAFTFTTLAQAASHPEDSDAVLIVLKSGPVKAVLLNKVTGKATLTQTDGATKEVSYDKGREIVEKATDPTRGTPTIMDDRKNAIGFVAGDILGLGFSYQRVLSEDFGVQVSAIGNYSEYSSMFVAGLQGIYFLKEAPDYRVSVNAGGMYWISSNTSYDYSATDYEKGDYSNPVLVKNLDHFFSLGANLGLSYFFTKTKAFSVSAFLGTSAWYKTNWETKQIELDRIGLSGGSSLMWHFNLGKK